jgi:Ca-activated chloride channel homolog
MTLKSFTALLASVLIACIALAQSPEKKPGQNQGPPAEQAQSKENPQFRIDVNFVTIRFSVKDGQGKFVTSLQEKDFSVFEEGLKQEVTFFEPPRKSASNEPVSLTFMLDVSGSTLATRSEEVAAAENFLRNVPSGTETAVYAFAEKLHKFQDFTPNAALVNKALDRAQKGILGRTNLYSAVSELAEILSKRTDGRRRVLVIISDGEDPDTVRAEAAIQNAIQSGITVFTIWVPSARAIIISEMEEQAREPINRQHATFASLAQRTGGHSFESFESILDFDGTLAAINATLFGSLYTIGYYTSDPEADRLSRRIEVATNRTDYQVQGVFANLPERLQLEKQFVSALFENSKFNSARYFEKPFQEIGAALDLFPMKPSALLEGLPFRIVVNPFSLARLNDRNVRTHLGILVILTDSKGQEVSRVRDFMEVNLTRTDLENGRTIVYNGKVLAPAGDYLFRLALLDLSNWRVSAFQNNVTIRAKR